MRRVSAQPPIQRTAPSPDVGSRLDRVSELLKQMSVPVARSEPPPDLIAKRNAARIEITRTESGEKRPVLDAATFEVLSKLVLANTPHLRRELKNRFEFLNNTVDMAPTPSQRWYFRIEDGRGQKMDVIFGGGLFPRARIHIHDHMGRAAHEVTLSREATVELANLILGAPITPAPQEEESYEPDVEDDQEAARRQAEKEKRRKAEDLRQVYYEEAKDHIRGFVESAPLKYPPILRELARKKADELSEPDLERILSTLADEPIILRAFEVDGYDGSNLRLSRSDARGVEPDFIALNISGDPAQVSLRIQLRRRAEEKKEVQTKLEGDQYLQDEFDDDDLTPSIDVTRSPLGLAILKYAAKISDPPIRLDRADELVKLLQPPRSRRAPAQAPAEEASPSAPTTDPA